MFILLVSVVLLTFLPRAFADGGGNFVLQAPTQANPSSVDPGVSAIATITVGSTGGFSDPVALSCAITSGPTANPPTCVVSPESVTPVGSATLTINTTSTTSPSLYTITVTGTASSGTQTAPVNVTVLAVTPQYTITVTTPMSPSSIHAGSGATAGITVTPLNGYAGSVTLSCNSISPVVTPNAPVCSFLPQPVVVAGTIQLSTMTVTTFGPATAAIPHPRLFYAFWFPVAGLVLSGMGFGVSGRRRKSLFGLLTLGIISLGLVLTPACGSSSTTTSSTSGVTPNNTYTFTLTGADANAVAPSNTDQTVSLTVN
jgi:hypothetical protein